MFNNKLSPSSLTIPNLKKSYKSPNAKQQQRPKSTIVNGGHKDPMTDSTMIIDQATQKHAKGQEKKTTAESKYSYRIKNKKEIEKPNLRKKI